MYNFFFLRTLGVNTWLSYFKSFFSRLYKFRVGLSISIIDNLSLSSLLISFRFAKYGTGVSFSPDNGSLKMLSKSLC